MDHADAADFAERWVQDWNRHDVDALLAHFSEDVVFTSPVAARVLPETNGIVRGRDALREYWSFALTKIPDLHFEVVGVYAGIDTVVINYRNHTGGLVCEVLRFGTGEQARLVVEGHGTYPGVDAAASSGVARD